jgi:hypothetical protein
MAPKPANAVFYPALRLETGPGTRLLKPGGLFESEFIKTDPVEFGRRAEWSDSEGGHHRPFDINGESNLL